MKFLLPPAALLLLLTSFAHAAAPDSGWWSDRQLSPSGGHDVATAVRQSGPVGDGAPPMAFTIECKAGALEVFFDTKRPIEKRGAIAVAYRIDGGETRQTSWITSVEGGRIYVREPFAFLRELAGRKTLGFRYDNVTGAVYEAVFAIDGLDGILQGAAKECGW